MEKQTFAQVLNTIVLAHEADFTKLATLAIENIANVLAEGREPVLIDPHNSIRMERVYDGVVVVIRDGAGKICPHFEPRFEADCYCLNPINSSSVNTDVVLSTSSIGGLVNKKGGSYTVLDGVNDFIYLVKFSDIENPIRLK